jgi:hypothetical protein
MRGKTYSTRPVHRSRWSTGLALAFRSLAGDDKAIVVRLVGTAPGIPFQGVVPSQALPAFRFEEVALVRHPS